MSRVTLKTMVLNILAPDLRDQGFAPVTDSPHPIAVEFRRQFRGYENRISLEKHSSLASAPVKGIRFALFAPNYLPTGLNRYYLPGGKDWWFYTNSEELQACLKDIRDLLVSAGMDWFRRYTPGDVPEWRQHVAHIVTPFLANVDFEPYQRPLGTMPDFPLYRHTQKMGRIVGLDFRTAGLVRIVFNQGLHTVTSPDVPYRDEIGLVHAIEQVTAYIQDELPAWMR